MTIDRPRKLAVCVLLIFAALGLVSALYGQAVSVATVTGRVTDQQGAVVTGAKIALTGVDTGAVHNAVTNEDGIYTIPSLPIGAYTFQAAAPGFQTYVQTGIILRVNDNVQISVTMKVGQVGETVEVQANTGMVQTQQNTISQVIDQRPHRRPAAEWARSDAAHYDLRGVDQSQRWNQHGQ